MKILFITINIVLVVLISYLSYKYLPDYQLLLSGMPSRPVGAICGSFVISFIVWAIYDKYIEEI